MPRSSRRGAPRGAGRGARTAATSASALGMGGVGGSGGPNDPFGGSGGPGGPGGPRHARPGGPGDGDDGGPDGARKRRRSWPQRLVLGAGLGLVLFCLLGASVAGYALVQVMSIDRVEDLDLAQAAKGDPENFLVVAVDAREGEEDLRNTDTIMVARIDPKSERIALTSFPRDLMVTIADTGRTGQINSAYSHENGEQVLMDTIQQNFGITINHFVEVNFASFEQVVDAVGGVPVYVPYALRDDGSGLYIEEYGCINMDGKTGLEFARARKLKIQDEDGDWVKETQSDINRVKRQQIFVQRAMSKALGQVKSNPLRVQELVNIGKSNVRLDANLTVGDMVDLGNQFKGFDPAALETYPLPTVPYPQDENRLLLDEAAAEPMLNVFRGLAPDEISPGLINVTVLNGTVATDDEALVRQGLAGDVSAALQKVGFDMNVASDADSYYEQTTIVHAPGDELYAQRLARYVTSETAIPTVADPEMTQGEVTLVAGADFTTVHDQPTPVDQMPAAAGAEQTTTTAPAETTTTTTAPPPTTTTTERDPYIVGEPPPGTSC